MHSMSDARLEAQRQFIEAKLPKSKLFDKYGLTLVDANDVIIRSMMGELRNVIHTFFQGGLYSEKKCEHCGNTTAKQYERAHNRGDSRSSLALSALQRIRPDETQSITQKAFMLAFIEEHTHVPLWYLCKDCHVKYDA